MNGGKRVPDGEPIADYYPEIIEPKTFWRVQEMLSAKAGKGGRRASNRNLFTHVARCGYCGAPMQIIGGRDHAYLQCNRALRGIAGCLTNRQFPYNELETAFLTMCGSLDVAALLPHDDEQAQQINSLKLELKAIDGQLQAVAKKKANADKLMGMADDEATLKHVAQQLKKAIAEQTKLEAYRQKITDQLKKAESSSANTARQVESVKALIETMGGLEGDELAELRGRLKAHIQELVKTMWVFPNGNMNKVLTWTFPAVEYIETDERKLIVKQTGKNQRSVGIWFNGGGFRQIAMNDAGKYQIGLTLKNETEAKAFLKEMNHK